MPHDIFVSYATTDKPIADALVANLEAKQLRCWIAPRDVLPGKPYAEALADAIDESHLLILVFSSGSNVSPQVMREVERAVHKDIPIIPFRIENIVPTKGMAYLVEGLHWLDAITPPLQNHLDRLSETVRILLNQETAEPSCQPSTIPIHPPKRRVFPLLVLFGGLIIGTLIGTVTLFNMYKKTDNAITVCKQEPRRIVIAGKKFLESSILVELMAIALESKNSDIEIVREHYRADSMSLFNDITEGKIDIYPEYSGTLLVEQLREGADIYKNDEMHTVVSLNTRLLLNSKGQKVQFLEPFGFDNPFVVVMLRKKAHQLRITDKDGTANISGLVLQSQNLKFSGTPSFRDREDGRQFFDVYQLKFKEQIAAISHEMKYKALNKGEFHVTDGYGTDHQLLDPNFITLHDDRKYFPPYKAAPLVRKEILCPEIESALGRLAGKVRQDDMVRLISRAFYAKLNKANLTSDTEAQLKLRNLVYKFAQAQGIIEPGLPEVVLIGPAAGDKKLRVRIKYEWKLSDDRVSKSLYELERRRGKDGPFLAPVIVRRTSYSDPTDSDSIMWRVRAVHPDRPIVGKWSEWREVQRDSSSWSRIRRTGTVHIGVGKADGLFIHEGGKRIGGFEIDLLRKLIEYRLRKELNDDRTSIRFISHELEWGDEMFNALRKNDVIDLLVSRISITNERKKKYGIMFTNPTISYPQAIIAKANRPVVENGRITLARLGAQYDTTNENLARKLLEHSFGSYVAKRSEKKESCDQSPCLLLWAGHLSDLDELEALNDLVIDGIVVDKVYAHYLAKTAGFEVQVQDITSDLVPGIDGLANEKIGFAVRIEDKELRDNINQAITEKPLYLRKFWEQVLPVD